MDIDHSIAEGFSPTRDSPLLHWAAFRGEYQNVEMLIKEGYNLNEPDEMRSFTPLHYAICRKHDEIVKLLIEKGANLNVVRKRGHTPLHLAVEFKQWEMVKLLLEKAQTFKIFLETITHFI
jgi:ankyrin repeat protein